MCSINVSLCPSFNVNIGPNETDIALHVDPRFNYGPDINTVVCNTYQRGSWHVEVRERSFPFCRGVQFKVHFFVALHVCYSIIVLLTCLSSNLCLCLFIQIIIYLTPREFVVTLPDGCNIHFPNRLGEEHYSFITVGGDVCISSFTIK